MNCIHCNEKRRGNIVLLRIYTVKYGNYRVQYLDDSSFKAQSVQYKVVLLLEDVVVAKNRKKIGVVCNGNDCLNDGKDNAVATVTIHQKRKFRTLTT